MRTVVLFESIFGSTRKIAEAIALGVQSQSEVTVLPIAQGDAALIAETDLIIVGAPTHALSMSTPATRAQAVQWTTDPAKNFALDNGIPTTGIREWLEELGATSARFAAFDTRVTFMSHFPGSAAAQVDKALRKRGMTRVVRPESFLVESAGGLVAGEEARATEWGATIAGNASAAMAGSPSGSSPG